MSTDSLAILRKSLGDDIAKLAEEHYKHDLQDSDRDTLMKAVKTRGTHVVVGSLLGLGLGLFLSFRLRSSRAQMFNAFRATEKPTHVKFASGREEAVPTAELEPLLKPTTLGDVTTYLFFGAGGLLFGGETGILTGGFSANRTLSKDPESRARIEAAFRKFRADVLRKEADALDGGKSIANVLGF